LTRSKLESNLPLICVLFDRTRIDFFLPEGKKFKNFMFLGEIFQTQTIEGRPDPGYKIFDRDPSPVDHASTTPECSDGFGSKFFDPGRVNF